MRIVTKILLTPVAFIVGLIAGLIKLLVLPIDAVIDMWKGE